MSFLDNLKKPSFWLSALAGLGAVGSALGHTGNPVVTAIGGAIVAVYTLAEHLASAVQAGQQTATTVQADLKAGNAIAAVSAATAALSGQVAALQQTVTDAAAVANAAKSTAQTVVAAANAANAAAQAPKA